MNNVILGGLISGVHTGGVDEAEILKPLPLRKEQLNLFDFRSQRIGRGKKINGFADFTGKGYAQISLEIRDAVTIEQIFLLVGSIDIDIEIFGKEAVSESDLIIPHERLTERAFVLKPLVEILKTMEKNADKRVMEIPFALDFLEEKLKATGNQGIEKLS